ncbi:hypothetical protein BCR36DRAFT_584313 [Piromyces finnis]|uniref:Uncharacterized protein n=1 Tax=Piromyces finnis TaxID=1754191 RepID=A0A1Y1V8C5_9FUNG|nr:hypothetical protein BCR36DRAFT_584313 [Piromyces finnis]|eukprot:ORX48395.1 hypothetical protein BCR36DRAFT_584313 [Piromyces finnis]
MLSVYKGLLLFILIANVIAIPVVKRESKDGKSYIFETIRTVLNCICYYEEGETLTNGKIDKYCDCTPEEAQNDKSVVDEDEIETKVNNARYITSQGFEVEEEENFSDVQRYGSADAAFFANVEENEAKQEQENLEDELAIPLFNGDGKFIPKVDDGEDVDIAQMEGDVIEDVPEYDDTDGFPKDTNINETRFALSSELNIGIDNNEIDNDEVINNESVYYDANNKGDFDAVFSDTKLVYNSLPDIDTIKNENEEVVDDFDVKFSNTRYVYNNLDNNNNSNNEEIIYDENGNQVNFEIEMVGEAYEEVAAEDEYDDDVPSRPTIIRDGKKILEMDEPIVGANAKYVIDYYNNEQEINDEIIDENMELDLEEDFNEQPVVKEVDSVNSKNIVSVDNKADKNQEKITSNDNDDKDDLDLNDDDDIRSIYKKLVIKKLKNDIKKIDSEKLIVDIIKEALQGGSNKK